MVSRTMLLSTILIATRVCGLPVRTSHSVNFVVAMRGLTSDQFTPARQAVFNSVVATNAGDVCGSGCAIACTSDNIAVIAVASTRHTHCLSVTFALYTHSSNASATALRALSTYMGTSTFVKDLISSGGNMSSVTAITLTSVNVTGPSNTTASTEGAGLDSWWITGIVLLCGLCCVGWLACCIMCEDIEDDDLRCGPCRCRCCPLLGGGCLCTGVCCRCCPCTRKQKEIVTVRISRSVAQSTRKQEVNVEAQVRGATAPAVAASGKEPCAQSKSVHGSIVTRPMTQMPKVHAPHEVAAVRVATVDLEKLSNLVL